MLSGFSLGVVVFVVVFIGSFLQRVSGMGLGLVAGPVLSLILGPVEGILVVNVLAAINAAMTTFTVQKFVDWQKFWLISSVLIIGAIPGAWLIQQLGSGWLQVLVGVVLLVALGLVSFGSHLLPPVAGKAPAVVAGIAGGFMNTLAGVAGPAITVYAQASKWEQRSFAATLQPIFIVSGLMSIIAKVGFIGFTPITTTSPVVWIGGVCAMIVGIFLGVKAEASIPRTKARTLAVALAMAGGATALVRGILALIS